MVIYVNMYYSKFGTFLLITLMMLDWWKCFLDFKLNFTHFYSWYFFNFTSETLFIPSAIKIFSLYIFKVLNFCLLDLSPLSIWNWFSYVMWDRNPYSFFPMDSQFLLHHLLRMFLFLTNFSGRTFKYCGSTYKLISLCLSGLSVFLFILESTSHYINY